MKYIEILIAEYLFGDTVEKAIECAKENEFESCLDKARHILQMVHSDMLKRLGSNDTKEKTNSRY